MPICLGVIEQLSTAPPPGSVIVCLDEMGPERPGAPGQRLVQPAAPEAERASRRSTTAGGAAATFSGPSSRQRRGLQRPYDRRTTANWVDFLGEVEAW